MGVNHIIGIYGWGVFFYSVYAIFYLMYIDEPDERDLAKFRQQIGNAVIWPIHLTVFALWAILRVCATFIEKSATDFKDMLNKINK